MKKAKQRLQNVACDWYKGVSEEKKIGEYAKTRKKNKKLKIMEKIQKICQKKTNKKRKISWKKLREYKKPHRKLCWRKQKDELKIIETDAEIKLIKTEVGSSVDDEMIKMMMMMMMMMMNKIETLSQIKFVFLLMGYLLVCNAIW